MVGSGRCTRGNVQPHPPTPKWTKDILSVYDWINFDIKPHCIVEYYFVGMFAHKLSLPPPPPIKSNIGACVCVCVCVCARIVTDDIDMITHHVSGDIADNR